MAFAPPCGRQPSIEWVPIGELLIDDSYQRSIDTAASKKLIRDIASAWDWDVLDILKVSRRPDDRLFLVDGQHRRAAADLRGDIPQLPCVLKRCTGPAQEARLFIASNRGRKRMSPIDDFRAAIGAGDADALAVDRAVTAASLSIARHEMSSHLAAGELMNVVGLRNMMRRYGEATLAEALKVLAEAFPDEIFSAPNAMLGAICMLLGDRPACDPDALFETLLAGTTSQWAYWADLRTIRGGGKAQAAAMVRLVRHRYAAGIAARPKAAIG